MPQIQHSKDEIVVLDPVTDSITHDTFTMCIGHGCRIPLKIGVDVAEVPDDIEKCTCYSTSHNSEGNYYLVRFDCPIHRGTLK